MERIVIETDSETKQSLKKLALNENKTMKELFAEAIRSLLKRLR